MECDKLVQILVLDSLMSSILDSENPRSNPSLIHHYFSMILLHVDI